MVRSVAEAPTDLPLLVELKRRRVFRALIGYGIAAFAVLQVIEPVMHGLHWPDAVLSYVVVALAVGFPVVVALAWIFDLRGGRIERTPAATGTGGARLTLTLLAIGLAAAAPVVIYHFAFREGRSEDPARAAAAPSIAVLPFVNMSSDEENEYLSEGITEELINALANIDGLRVASRTAVFALRGSNASVQQIGADLRVESLLEGSVRREGNALRVTAQLINVKDGYHVWSKTYDRELKSIFTVEDEIARAIAEALQRKLVRVKAATANVQAHDLYLRGRYFWNKRNTEGILKAAAYFEQAIAEDPAYALAYAGLADALALRADYDRVPHEQVLPKARAAAHRALELDPQLAEAHASLGLIAHFELDHQTALKELRTALDLKPDYAMARKWYGDELAITGKLNEARVEFDRALRDDPTSLIINFSAASARMYDQDYEGAAALFRKTLEMDPSFAPSHMGLIELYTRQGKYDDALAEVDRATQNPCTAKLFRAFVLGRTGQLAKARGLAKEAEDRCGSESLSYAYLGSLWMSLGDKDKAFALLHKACARKETALAILRFEPGFDSVRSDPRYREVLRCAKLE